MVGVEGGIVTLRSQLNGGETAFACLKRLFGDQRISMPTDILDFYNVNILMTYAVSL
jgi:hypothetical protein